MKLNYLLTSANAKAGTERAIADQTRSMAARGHEVTVTSVYKIDEDGFDFGNGVSVNYITDLVEASGRPSLIIPEEWDNQFCIEADTQIMQYLRLRDDDVTIASTPALAVYALLACPVSTKIVQEEHRNTMSRGTTAEPIFRHGEGLDALVLLTERNREWLHEKLNVRSPRMEVIPNSLAQIARPKSSGNQKVIMGAGRLVRGKGFVNLVRAFARVADEFPEWRLRIFGDGPDRDKIFTMARNLGVARQIEIFPPTEAIEHEWARASIGALASVSEGLPLVLLEARGAGLPLVAFDCETGPREIIKHGRDGYLVTPGDIGAFAEALRLLMSDDSRRAEISSHAEESLRRFTPEIVTDQWEELFNDLTNQKLSKRDAKNQANIDVIDDKLIEQTSEIELSNIDNTPAGDFQSNKHPEASLFTDLDGVIPRNARLKNQELLFELFNDSVIRCRPIKSTRGLSWAVPLENRDSFLQHISNNSSKALEVRLYAGRTRLDDNGYSWRTVKDELNWNDVTRIFLFHHFEVPGTRRHVGFAAGVTVEFWDKDERRPALYRAPRVNDEIDHLTLEQFSEPLFSAWAPMRSMPLWSSVNFPIDVVYTWVDGADPIWRAKRAIASGDDSPTKLAGGEIRYRNRDELRYSLRSLHEHAPWVRHIYIVTDGQTPEWLRAHEKLSIIDHRSIFPEPELLPVFNSHAIESVLHLIPGLSENFIYLNDDVFMLKDQHPEQYFTSVGQAKFFPSSTKINELGEYSEPHEAAGGNNRKLIENDFGVSISQGMLHTPHPHKISILSEISERYSSQVSQTRRNQFRNAADLSMLSSLGQYFGYLNGKYVQGALNVSFVPLGNSDTIRRLAQIKHMNLDCLTFGESESDDNPELTQEIATNFMRSMFQVPAPWEQEVY